MLKKFGRTQEAEQMYEIGRAREAQHRQANPDDEKARANLGVMVQRLGEVALELKGDARTTLGYYEEAKKLHEPIERKQGETGVPVWEIHRTLGHDDMHLGRAFPALGQAAQARRLYQEALGYYEEWRDAEPQNILAPVFIKEAQMYLGIVAVNRNDSAGVEKHFAAALKLGLEQMQRTPTALTFEVDQLEMESAYGEALTRLGRYADAEKHLLESLRWLRIVIAQRPDDTAFQPLLAEVHERLAVVGALMDKPTEAKENRDKALAIRKSLWETEPSSLSRQTAFVPAMARAGDFAQAARLAASIRPRMVKSPEFMLQPARAFALCAVGVPADRKSLVEQAVAALVTATSDDYKDAVPLETDPELATLRAEPAFKELAAKIKAR